MHPLPLRYQHLTEEIQGLSARYRRPADAVRLVAVSKQHSVDKVVELARLGQRDFAENYAQEGVEKIRRAAQLLSGDGVDSDPDPDSETKPNADPATSLCWHFIGHIQSRKCRLIAENFHWVHSVDSGKVAHTLNRHRAGAPLNVLIQVNLQGEASKSGVSEAELPPLAGEIAGLPNLRLRGLMILPKAEKDFAKQRAVFRRCREARDGLNTRGFHLDHLSMGMTADREAAIAEGATLLRIGTALFGTRPGKP